MSSKEDLVATNFGTGTKIATVLGVDIKQNDLTVATATALGGIKIGYTADLTNKKYPVQLDGGKAFVQVPWEKGEYTLPAATTSTLGGIKVGSGLKINSGVLSADITHPVPLSQSQLRQVTSGLYFNKKITCDQEVGTVIFNNVDDSEYTYSATNLFGSIKMKVAELPPMTYFQIGKGDTWYTVLSMPDSGSVETQEFYFSFFCPKGYSIRFYVTKYSDNPTKKQTITYTMYLHRLAFIQV